MGMDWKRNVRSGALQPKTKSGYSRAKEGTNCMSLKQKGDLLCAKRIW